MDACSYRVGAALMVHHDHKIPPLQMGDLEEA